MNNISSQVRTEKECYHCGKDLDKSTISYQAKKFCCQGCQSVYQILNDHDLDSFYDISTAPGISLSNRVQKNFDFLDDLEIIHSFIEFQNEEEIHVSLKIPQIHCFSCVWLLEKLPFLNEGIKSSKINYGKKELSLILLRKKTTLKEVVVLLYNLGYEPELKKKTDQKTQKWYKHKKTYLNMGIVGFCYGNIMLLSFPEYFKVGEELSQEFAHYFSFWNLVLSIPLLIFGAKDYFKSAFGALRTKNINLDIPIALGILALFFVSVFEILSKTGTGYIDSLAGLLFFLLIGKVFQQKTFDHLNFERDYKSYFPLAITKIVGDGNTTIAINKLKVSDRILVRNQEVIPCDSILMTSDAQVDYSFVTGESRPEKKVAGEVIYAGGKLVGTMVEMEVIKEASQSYLTRLWNKDDNNSETKLKQLNEYLGKYFTYGVLLVALGTLVFWGLTDWGKGIKAFTSVLIVACPCALALAVPFTFGNVMRLLGRKGFYLKNSETIEKIAKVDHVVFDKTGTLTDAAASQMEYRGMNLSDYDLIKIKSLVRNSTHPLSKKVFDFIELDGNCLISDFQEITGKGIQGTIDGEVLRLGSMSFVVKQSLEQQLKEGSAVHFSIGEVYYGSFQLKNVYRSGVKQMVDDLKSHQFQMSVISGDNASEEESLKSLTGLNEGIYFNQTPFQKRDFINDLKRKDAFVMMVGDGLNDAGALTESQVGVAVAEDSSGFTPSSDIIVDSQKLTALPDFIKMTIQSHYLVYFCIGLSLAYNLLGLSFAVQGKLTPVFSAVLMPLSSVTVMFLAYVGSSVLGWRTLKKVSSIE